MRNRLPVMELPDAESLALWLDKSCRDKPLNDLLRTSLDLYVELRRRTAP